MQTCWETHSAYEKMCIDVATATLPPSTFTKRQQKEADLCKGFFALCRDCIKGPNLPTHADKIGVNVSAFVVPNSLQYDQGNTNLIPLFAISLVLFGEWHRMT
jgi:hypothetical protein